MSISVLNGNGVDGLGGERGVRARPARLPDRRAAESAADRNAPSFDYFHTKVYYDRKQPARGAAARKVAELFGDGEVARLPARLRAEGPAARC